MIDWVKCEKDLSEMKSKAKKIAYCKQKKILLLDTMVWLDGEPWPEDTRLIQGVSDIVAMEREKIRDNEKSKNKYLR